MQCDRAIELIGAYLDQELDAETRREVAAHLTGCAACAALGRDYRSVNEQVATLGRVPVPEHLIANVRSRLAGGTVETATRDTPFGTGWLRQVAVLLLACGVTAAVTMLVMSRVADRAVLEREVRPRTCARCSKKAQFRLRHPKHTLLNRGSTVAWTSRRACGT